MKNLILSLATVAMLCSTVGCANGPVRNFVRNAFGGSDCQAPPVDPSYGFGFDSAEQGGCASGNCGHSIQGGQVIGQSINGQQQIGNGIPGNQQVNGLPQSTSYMNDSYSQGDPYINGSNYGGATINPPVFDMYSGPTYGSTIVPPVSSGTLPTPQGN